ncbi:hypothetical protein F4804DRAFT_325756 [Jackrogersella minutella]|nr:hypothetical protein F4804DRAFT_325756 [Jackrogersella minutella]
MPHKSHGYFYYEYTYEPQYYYRPSQKLSEITDPESRAKARAAEQAQAQIDAQAQAESPPFRTAYHSRHREDHNAQAKWYRDKVVPAVEADCVKITDLFNGENLSAYPKEKPNRKKNQMNLVCQPFNWAYVRPQEFVWKENLPPTSEGRHKTKKKPYGREI